MFSGPKKTQPPGSRATEHGVAAGKRSTQGATERRGPDAFPESNRLIGEGDLALASTLLRSKTIRERYYLLMRLIYALSGLLGLAVFGLVVLAIRPINPVYFATSDDGRLVPIVPLSRPIMSNTALDNWVTTAVTKSLQISFSSYKSDIASAQQFFTPDGWKSYTTALTAGQLLDSIVTKRYNQFVVPNGAPVLISTDGAVNSDGVAYWVWQVPVSVTLVSADATGTTSHVITVTVVRIPETENPSGLGIASFIEQ